jgi:hypothetical protein
MDEQWLCDQEIDMLNLRVCLSEMSLDLLDGI